MVVVEGGENTRKGERDWSRKLTFRMLGAERKTGPLSFFRSLLLFFARSLSPARSAKNLRQRYECCQQRCWEGSTETEEEEGRGGGEKPPLFAFLACPKLPQQSAWHHRALPESSFAPGSRNRLVFAPNALFCLRNASQPAFSEERPFCRRRPALSAGLSPFLSSFGFGYGLARVAAEAIEINSGPGNDAGGMKHAK